jgi:transcription elongation GreA/GreB family factor
MAETYLTRAGHKKLEEELKALMKQKNQLSIDIGEAREKGDLKENAEYHFAKEEMGEVMSRIGKIQDKLQGCKLIEEMNIPKDTVAIGTTVSLEDSDGDTVEYTLVGEDESRPSLLGDFGGGREYSEETAKVIDEEIKKLIDRLYEETRQLIEANRDRVDAVAKALAKYETLDTQDLERIMRGDNLTRPTVSDLLDKERRGTVIQPGPSAADPDVLQLDVFPAASRARAWNVVVLLAPTETWMLKAPFAAAGALPATPPVQLASV